MYHTGLSAGMIRGAKYALVPGDPGRVEGLAKALDENALFVASHRDYTSWLARVENAPVLVMSTGMGGPCVTFAVEELARLGVETFIRVGTTGSIQEDLHPGDVVINTASVRMDGASRRFLRKNYRHTEIHRREAGNADPRCFDRQNLVHFPIPEKLFKFLPQFTDKRHIDLMIQKTVHLEHIPRTDHPVAQNFLLQ